jgi:hypothetical protein
MKLFRHPDKSVLRHPFWVSHFSVNFISVLGIRDIGADPDPRIHISDQWIRNLDLAPSFSDLKDAKKSYFFL